MLCFREPLDGAVSPGACASPVTEVMRPQRDGNITFLRLTQPSLLSSFHLFFNFLNFSFLCSRLPLLNQLLLAFLVLLLKGAEDNWRIWQIEQNAEAPKMIETIVLKALSPLILRFE